MEITLRNYQPFALTNDLLDFIKRETKAPAKNFLDLAKSAGRLALAIISLIPVFVADLLVTTTALTFRACCIRSPNRKIPKPKEPYAPPPSYNPNLAILFVDSKQFMQNALRTAFSVLPPNTIKLYRELIADGGLPSDDCEEYVDIFQWTASVYLSHFLKHSHRDLSKLYPCTHPEFDHRKSQPHIQELRKNVGQLQVFFNLRTAKERDAALEKIISPEIGPKPEGEVKDLINRINGIAVLMTQDPYFMKNIYCETATL